MALSKPAPVPARHEEVFNFALAQVDVRLGPELRSYALRSVGAWIDVYDCGMELLDMGLCWIRDDPDEGSQAEELAVAKAPESLQLAGRELLCLTGFSSVCSMPSHLHMLQYASANLGGFTVVTFCMSAVAAVALTLCTPVILHKYPEVRRRTTFRAIAAATSIAAVGQVLFIVLANSTSLVGFHILPDVTVSQFFQPMQNPFVVLHLFMHSLELPLMSGALGRLAGRSWAEASETHMGMGVYSVCVVVSAAISQAWLRWPLLIIGAMVLKRSLADIEALPDQVDKLAPHSHSARVWKERHRICSGLFVCLASLHPTVQSMGYVQVLSPGSQQCIFAGVDLMLTAGLGFIALRDANHVVKAEVYLMAKEQMEGDARVPRRARREGDTR